MLLTLQMFSFAREKYYFLDGVLKGLLHLLVPQSIDKWIHHRSHRSIKNSYSFGQRCSFFGRRVSIHEDAAAIRDRDDNHVGGTGGESLFPLTDRWKFQNCLDDEHVGKNDQC